MGPCRVLFGSQPIFSQRALCKAGGSREYALPAHHLARIGEAGSDVLRLRPSLLDEARKLAEEESVALNQLINVAVAEKLSALRTESYIAERAARADIPKALAILKRAGVGRPPMKGDELPATARKRR